MHLLQVDWTTAARSWLAYLWLYITTLLDLVLRCASRLIGRVYRNNASVAALPPNCSAHLLYDGCFWFGGSFLVVPPVTFVSSVDRYLVYLDAEPFVPLLPASYCASC